MAFGAELVSDDQTCLRLDAGRLVASAPPAIAGLIEARGVGLLRALPCAEAQVALVVDLDREETERLPPRRSVTLLGVALPLLYVSVAGHFNAAIVQYMKEGRAQ